MSALIEHDQIIRHDKGAKSTEYIALSDAMMVLQERINGYTLSKRGSAIINAAERNTSANRPVKKSAIRAIDPKLECLVLYRPQIDVYMGRIYTEDHNIATGLIFTREVEDLQQANNEWDMHSDVMFDIADVTHATVTLRFMAGGELLIGAGYAADYPKELQSREYAVMAACAATQDLAAA